MSKLYFDYSGLMEKFNPSVSKGIDNLSDSISICRSMSIPNSFRYSSFLKNLPSTLSSCKSDLQGMNSWVSKSEKAFTKLASDITGNLKTLDVAIVNRRNKIIK